MQATPWVGVTLFAGMILGLTVLFYFMVYRAQKDFERNLERHLRGGATTTDTISPPFRAAIGDGGGYLLATLDSVHGDFLKVSAIDGTPRYRTIVIQQVHPDDRDRVRRTANSHPSAGDEYVFEP